MAKALWNPCNRTWLWLDRIHNWHNESWWNS